MSFIPMKTIKIKIIIYSEERIRNLSLDFLVVYFYVYNFTGKKKVKIQTKL